MSGGITQLVATGVQDAYLSGNPEISFFRSSYKRYTHFASNVERQLIQGNPSQSGVSIIRFEKKGDLLSHVYLTALDPNVASNVNVNWSTVISKMELMIGGQIVDTQDFTWSSNIEPVVGAQTFSTKTYKKDQTSSVFFPLKFFFCKDWQNALPLIALQYHDVEIRVTWAQPNVADQYAVWARFIYLDNDEREWFAKKQHDMLIQQVTRVPIAAQNNYEFALSQPIKFIAFESTSYSSVYNTPSNNLGSAAAANMQFKVQINGNDIGESRHLPHWQDINQYYLTPFGYDSVIPNNVVIVPFCLDTSKLQPTGTLNFSRIDTFRLICPTQTNFQQLSKSGAGSFFYAVNYNILRIQNGMAGLLYSS